MTPKEEDEKDLYDELTKEDGLTKEKIREYLHLRMSHMKSSYAGFECGCGSFVPEDPGQGTHYCMDCKKKIR
jgi:hypothetical protein